MNYDKRMEKLADIRINLTGKQALITHVYDIIKKQDGNFNDWKNLDTNDGFHYLKFRLETSLGSHERLIANLISDIHQQTISIKNKKESEIAQFNYIARTYLSKDEYKKAKLVLNALNCDDSVKQVLLQRFRKNNVIWEMSK